MPFGSQFKFIVDGQYVKSSYYPTLKVRNINPLSPDLEINLTVGGYY